MKKRGPGRETVYTEALAAEILDRLAAGESLRRICEPESMPAASTVVLWVHEDREGFAERYAQARRTQAEMLADEIFEIADDGRNDTYLSEDREGNPVEKVDFDHIQRSRLRVDTRKWYLSKVLPKFRDRHEVSGPDGGPVEIHVTRTIVRPDDGSA